MITVFLNAERVGVDYDFAARVGISDFVLHLVQHPVRISQRGLRHQLEVELNKILRTAEPGPQVMKSMHQRMTGSNSPDAFAVFFR